MPLEILGAIVIGGLLGIYVLLRATGHSQPVTLTVDSAQDAWLRHAPGTKIQTVIVSEDGSAALIRTARRTGIVWAFGADTVARFVRHHDITSTQNGLRIRLNDFGAPAVSLTLTNEEREIWRKILRPE